MHSVDQAYGLMTISCNVSTTDGLDNSNLNTSDTQVQFQLLRMPALSSAGVVWKPLLQMTRLLPHQNRLFQREDIFNWLFGW